MTERDYPGRFIVLEGGDGAGKTTQARLLADALIAAGRSVTLTREPGGSVSAEAVRGLLLSDLDWTRESEVLLYTVARIEHVERVIRPSLARGNVVVCDRFIDSTFAYQGAGFGAEAALLQQMAELAGIKPDVVIVLDTSPEVGLGRVLQRESGNNRYDKADVVFRWRVRQAFLDRAVAGGDRYVVIDADRPIAEVREAIWQEVDRRFGPLVRSGRTYDILAKSPVS